MTDEEYLNMFIKEAKKAYKTIDNKAYNFPITINTAYRLAVSIEKCLKKQPNIIRCKECKFGEACKNRAGEHGVMCYNSHSASHSWVHEPDWFCADGKPKEDGEENE